MTLRHTLTADDVRALRAADGFHVWLDGEHAQLLLSKQPRRHPSRDGFSTPNTEATRRILCNISSTTTGSAGAMYRTGALRALALVVRPGDALLWSIRENGNNYLHAAKIAPGALDFDRVGYGALYCDEMLVSVIRSNRRGRETRVLDELVMDYAICPDNTARMARQVTKIDLSRLEVV